jgi:signal transduction histidine kinase
VELHGGSIAVQSRERPGSEFTFSLPMRPLGA